MNLLIQNNCGLMGEIFYIMAGYQTPKIASVGDYALLPPLMKFMR
jgi:hypothetical protein